MPHLKPAYSRSLAVIDGRENLDAILARGKGCIVVTIHMGGWEGCAALWGSLDEYRSSLVAEVLEPPALWRRLLELRQSSGIQIIPLGRAAPRAILRLLKENTIVAGAIDRDILATGKPYQFFGRHRQHSHWPRRRGPPDRRRHPPRASACASPTTPTVLSASTRSGWGLRTTLSMSPWASCSASSRTASAAIPTSGM